MPQRRPDRERLRSIWPFSKPKTPGFGISRGFYLSVLCGTARMPTLAEILNPTGLNGAVAGMGAPLWADSTPSDLTSPIRPGMYALASENRKTVLKGTMIGKDEAGFDPEAILDSTLALLMDQETLLRIRSTWNLFQLTFEAHDPTVYPSLDFLLDVATRVGVLADGVIADPIAQRYLLPDRLRASNPLDANVDARNFISIDSRAGREVIVYTKGLSKFALPEFEILDLKDANANLATEFLMGLCQTILTKGPVSLGGLVGNARAPFEIREGGVDRRVWDGIPCYELFPIKTATPDEALTAWKASGLDRT